jgi:hypothetical protein
LPAPAISSSVGGSPSQTAVSPVTFSISFTNFKSSGLTSEMDFKTDKLSSQFVFNNPNQKSACGCGESVNLEPSTPAGFAPAES